MTTPFTGHVHARMHDRRRARELRRPASPLMLLALLALAFGGYLLLLAWRPARHAPSQVGIIFVAQFFHELIRFVVEEVARP